MNRESALNKTYQRFIEICIKSISEDELDELAISEIMGFGTARDEIIKGVEEAKDLLRKQREQSKGLKIEYILKPQFKKINEKTNSAIVVDEIELEMQSEDFNHQLLLRITTCLEFQDKEWKIVHWHGSIPQESTSEDTWHIDEWKRKAEELQNLVDQKTTQLTQQNIELEIEAALERVRSTAMSMQKPEDLSTICGKIFLEMKGLGFKELRNTEIILNQDEKENIRSFYFSDYGVTGVVDVDCKSNPTILKWFYDLQKQDDAFAEVIISRDQMKEWEEYRQSLGYVPDPKLKKADKVYYYSYATGSGALSISSFTSLGQDEIDVLKRFRNVFNLAYKRYNDIQLAEQQAREAQVEAALERVRARSMAMHSSDELGDVAKVMFDQMQMLGGDLYSFAVVLCDKHKDVVEQWHGLGEAGMMSPFHVPIDLDYIHQYRYDQWKAGVELFSIEIPSDYIVEHFELMFDLPTVAVVKDELSSKGIELTIPPWEIDYGASFKNGYLLISSLSHFEEDYIFPRFARVFEQAYTRFLDLQKAEAQGREAEIQLALERVRAASMAMYTSDELASVTRIFFEQLSALKIEVYRSWIDIFHEDEGYILTWSTDFEGNFQPNPSIFPLDFDDTMSEFLNDYNSPSRFIELEAHGKEVEEWFEFLYEASSDPIFKMKDVPNDLYQVWAKHKYGTVATTKLTPLTVAEKEILVRFAKVFEQSYTRFLDLQTAEDQAREAQIEASLERVRARSMAMHDSSEMLDVADVLFQQIRSLGGALWGCGVLICKEDSDDDEVWFANEKGVLPPVMLPHTKDPVHRRMYEGWLNKEEIYSVCKEGKSLEAHYEYMLSEPTVKPLFEDILASGLSFPTWQKWHAAYFTQGYLFIITLDHYKEDRIFTRFAKVFEQAYTRFLDLQKAEAQAREAQIEAALERVRGRAMSMHKSEELSDLVSMVFHELIQLDMELTRCLIWVIDEDRSAQWWMANPEEPSKSNRFIIPNHDHIAYQAFLKAWQKNEKLWEYNLHGKVKESWDQYLFNDTELTKLPNTVQHAMMEPDKVIITATFNGFGALQAAGLEPLSDENQDILKRFGQVFDQTYTRFLDLKKAEAQAREAQIEAALERVRSRTMGMQSSSELPEVANVIDVQVRSLGINLWSVSYNILAEDNKSCICIPSSEGQVQAAFTIPFEEEKSFHEWMDALDREDTFFIQELDGEDITSHYDYLLSLPGIADAVDPLEEAGIEFPTYQINHLSFFKYGFLLFITYEKVPEAYEIFKRFTRVFEQTYARFLDLKKAEEQAQEARIELSLEKIRSQVTAMQESSDLFDIVVQMRNEFLSLGHEADYFWHMRWSPENYEMSMTSTDGNRLGMVITVPKFVHEQIESLHQWENSTSPYFVLDLDAKGAWDYLEKMNTYGHYEQMDPHAPSEEDIHHIGGLTFIIARTTHGEIGFSLAGKVPDPPQDSINTLVRFAGVFDLAYQRFEDLKETEHQKREAEIELALEKVRSRSMGMQSSEELEDVIKIVYDQLVGLDIFIEHTGFIMDIDTRDDMLIWLADPNGVQSQVTIPYFDSPHWNSYLEAKEKAENFFVNNLDFEEKNTFYNKLFEFIPDIPEEARKHYLSCPGLAISTVLMDNVGLYMENFSGTPYSDEDNEILMRFGRVFQQTYTRFLDLKKAEEQGREAQINLALERVRARTMAMHKSEELADISFELFKQVQSLGVTTWHCAFNIYDEYQESSTEWGTNEGGVYPKYKTPREGIFKRYYEIGQSGESLHIETIGEDKSEAHYEWLCSLPGVGEQLIKLRDAGVAFPTSQIDHVAYFKYGYLIFITYEPVPEAHEIFKRFAKIFEQSYTRFLDLKKSEEQAHEARIETALEKVRSRTMAMQQSDELQMTANLLFQQVQSLGMPAWSAGYCIWDEEMKGITAWMSSEGVLQPPFYAPTTEDKLFSLMRIMREKGEDFFAVEMGGEELVKHYEYMRSLPVVGDILDSIIEAGHPLPTYQIMHYAYFSHGLLLFITYEPVPEAHDIFKRFAKVFEQTYIRFLDLKKAENQTREAKIETALERVRARAMAMQEPEELKDVAQVLRTEMGNLDIEELETCSIYIKDTKSSKAECWYAIKDIRQDETVLIKDQISLNLKDTYVGREMLDFYSSDHDRVSILMSGQNRVEWIKYCEEKSSVLHNYYGEDIPDRTYHLYKFSNGSIGFASAGPISDESWNILTRAASAFSLAYSRFQDLTRARQDLIKLKEEKKRAEDALSELKEAQKQLIHAEKMASLGELTAGIAHEIQNPLNFVNNFSEVSHEMIEEVKEELKDGDPEEVEAILNDLTTNLEKIAHHGRRASGIVRSMLDHSRASGGEKVETDINALCDEYLRLAYHGMRAKDRNFNAELVTSFDESLPKIKVIPQDLGRVLLNLINNAFQAVSEARDLTGFPDNKHKTTPEDPNSLNQSLTSNLAGQGPKVIVTTKNLGDKIEIAVSDNGPGIPDDIKDKIFQPFFTTKPTGEGTGLGLSLSYDIIKAHGGKITLESSKNEGTSFYIDLPKNSSS